MNWPTKKLGEVCEVVKSIRPSSVYDDDFLYIDIASVDPRRKIISEPRRLKITEAPGRARQPVKAGDSIFATTRPYLENIALITDEFEGAIASTGFCIISPNRKICDPRYIFLIVSSKAFIERVLVHQKGASYPAVSDQDIFNIEILIPPIGEQKKIVARIEKQFAKIDEAARLRAESEADTAKLLPAGLHEIFSSAESKRWGDKKLGEICLFENGDRGVNYPSKQHRVSSGVPFVNAGHLTNSEIEMQGMDFISRERFNMLNAGKIQKGDILFCLRGSLGKVASVGHMPEGAIASSLVIIRSGELISDTFLLYFLKSNLCQEYVARHKNGAAQPNLSAQSLKSFKIPLPPLAEQKEIVKKLDALSEKVRALQALQSAQSADIKALKQSILNEAFSGNLV